MRVALLALLLLAGCDSSVKTETVDGLTCRKAVFRVLWIPMASSAVCRQDAAQK